MRVRDFVLDRMPLVLAFAAATGLLLLVVHLAYRPLRGGDVAYIVLLGACATCVVLAVEHRRHKRFRDEVAARLASPPGAPGQPLAPPSGAVSREQRALVTLLAAQQAAAARDLHRLQSEAEQHRAFIDLWVHQMKTPVAVLELTARQQQSAGDSEAWRSVAEEADALAHGLDLMLSTARLERFDLDLRPELIDLGAAARKAVNDLKRSWLRAGVYPRVHTAPGSPVTAETDPAWLQVVMRQLLTNAIKYSESGAHVDVAVEAFGNGARIAVRDTGIGIPQEDLPRVFDRFFTGVNGRAVSASTGMGLYLAAEVCRRLGHELSLESARGTGTTARVTITPGGIQRGMPVIHQAQSAGDETVRLGPAT